MNHADPEADALEMVPTVTDSPETTPIRSEATGIGSSRTAAMPLERSFEIAVNGLIGAYDLSPNAALQTHISQVLARVGVDRIEVPSGAVFDPSSCEAISTVSTENRDLYQRVSETLRPGWRGRGAILRPPQVAVWVADPSKPVQPNR